MQTLEQGREQGQERRAEPALVPTPTTKLMKMGNAIVRRLLRSPLHGMLSGSLMLLTYTGRKTGKRYTIPVEYSREGDVVTVFTYHKWARNLRGGAPVVAEIKRHRYEVVAEAISDDRAAVAAGLLAHLRKHPASAKAFKVRLDAAKQPNPDDAFAAARSVVMVRMRLAPGQESGSRR